MFLVVKVGWQEGCTSRLEAVLSRSLQGRDYAVVHTAAQLDDALQSRREGGHAVLFALALPAGGISCEYACLTSYLFRHDSCLDGWTGAVLVDGPGELFTKKIGRELIFLANRAGCSFPGKALVEGTGSLYNFHTQAALAGVGLQQAYEASAARLVRKAAGFAGPGKAAMPAVKHITVLHASSRKTSNTLLLWEMIRRALDPAIEVEEISLRNGAVVDCRGCSYETCRHFGEKGECFYGGVMVDQVYPAIRASQAIVLICPNYNDAVSANITAFFNRLTALFRNDSDEFARKRIYALIVSGYSGGDIVAEQIIGAMNCNKNFVLPGRFALVETANEPNSILRCPGIAQRAAAMADRISGAL